MFWVLDIFSRNRCGFLTRIFRTCFFEKHIWSSKSVNIGFKKIIIFTAKRKKGGFCRKSWHIRFLRSYFHETYPDIRRFWSSFCSGLELCAVVWAVAKNQMFEIVALNILTAARRIAWWWINSTRTCWREETQRIDVDPNKRHPWANQSSLISSCAT